MKKKVMTLGVLLSILTITSCTDESMSIQEPRTNPNPEKQENLNLKATEGRALLAKLFATAINEDVVAEELSKKVSLEKDGDREFLLEEIIPSKDLRSTSSLYASLDRSFTRTKDLRSTTEHPRLSNFESFESFVKYVVSIDPLVQVSVLSKNEETSSVDLKKEDVLTVYLPENFDDQKECILTAYDKNGKIHYLKSSEEPSVPVIVIGTNERLIPVKKGTSVLYNNNYGKLYYEGILHDYYFRPELFRPIGEITFPINPTTEPKYDREKHSDYVDYLEKARFTSQSAMREFESFWGGRPEMKYTIIPVKAPSIKFYGECTKKGWWKGATKDLNIRLFNWNRNDFGNYYLVHWTEIDGGALKEITPKVPGNLFGIKIEATFKIDLGEDDDEVGGALVAYNDKALNGQRYDVGQMFQFWIKIKE